MPDHSDDDMTLELGQREFPLDREAELRFQIVDSDGKPVRDFEVEHEKQMHLILVRRDLTGFQHLHPSLDAAGTWHIRIRIPDAGSYRVFADLRHNGQARTLAADLTVDGPVDPRDLPAEASTAQTSDGYEVHLEREAIPAGRETELRFTMLREGQPVAVEPYLGAGGHLVALRESDLAYLHVHPTGGAGRDPVAFMTEFPSAGRYRLFLQFKHDGDVHTAAFTREVSTGGDGTVESGGSGGHIHGG